MINNRKIARDRQRIREIGSRLWQKFESDQITDVVCIKDMVRISKFTKGTLYVFSTRSDFPAPFSRSGKNLFWRRLDFERWLQRKRASAAASSPAAGMRG